MKTLLSILSILTMVGIYSTGAFVPETQGTVDTAAGLVALSDADMARQVGGDINERAEIFNFAWGRRSICNSGSCDNSGDCEDCPRDEQCRVNFQHICVTCDGIHPAMDIDPDFPHLIRSWCEIKNNVCTYHEEVLVEWESCVQFVANVCEIPDEDDE